MSSKADDLRIRPGRMRHDKAAAKRPQSFMGEVMRAAKAAGHVGKRIGGKRTGSGSRFGRGRRAALSIARHPNTRVVIVKARVTRHRGTRFRAAPLSAHVSYLKREGVSRDGQRGLMFDAGSDTADERAFTERCKEDRHHFRFIVSPEDATDLGDLKTFTRELMSDAERDLDTKLDWVAVDHWNTDNPHIHILVRGRADDGEDLVISRDYISNGFRARASERVTLELGPRTELEIRSALEREVEAERWTSLDRRLQSIADEDGGVVDLRPGSDVADPEGRRLLIGRAAKLERLGLAEAVGPACWTLNAGLESDLRDLGIRGDIIKTMHKAMSADGPEPDVSAFLLHGTTPTEPVLGRLVDRGLDDELTGSAYAIVAGVDGRTHHLRFGDLELTGDAPIGGVVEARLYEDRKGIQRLMLATRSDLSLEDQVNADGATWLDRRLVSKDALISEIGFGGEVREAMAERAEHLVDLGLAKRQGQRLLLATDLLSTLRERELDAAIEKLSRETGLEHRPARQGEEVSGVYRQRVNLVSGRFAMIDDGMGFELVPWRPALEQSLGQQVSATLGEKGQVAWRLGLRRGLEI